MRGKQGCGLDPVRAGGRRSLLVLCVLLCTLGLAPAALAADFTWKGTDVNREWSLASNWVEETAPTAGQAIGTLTFPHLSSAACQTEPFGAPCYLNFNDLTGLSAEALVLDDADPYSIAGSGLTVGAGGIDASPANESLGGSAMLELPINLVAPQTWLDANRSGGAEGEDGLFLLAPVIGPASDPLKIEVSGGAALFLGSSLETGPLTIAGANPAIGGVLNGFVGLLPATLNAADGQPLKLEHIFAIGRGSIGRLETLDSTLAVGGALVTAGIQAAGAKLDPGSELSFEITKTGILAQIDYSQFTAAGAVALGGADIAVTVGDEAAGQEACPTLTPGQTFTFLSTTGGLTGSFANAPESGPEIVTQPRPICKGKSQTIKIRYHESGGIETVTGTVEASTGEGQEGKERQEAKERGEAKERQEAKESREARERQEAAERAAIVPPAAAIGILSETISKAPTVPIATLAGSISRVSRSGAFTLRITCPADETNCTGMVTLATLKAVAAAGGHGFASRARLLKLAAAPFAVAGGTVRRVTLHLSGPGLALLHRLHTVRARVTIAAFDQAGASHRSHATVTLRAAR
jgi:hypothetical protein